MTESFKVEGGRRLSGEIEPQGAKNEALQVICATLLTDQKVTIENIPDIVDVRKLISLLRGLNVDVQKIDTNTYSFQAEDIDMDYLSKDEFQDDAKKIRGSVMLIGPLLARFGRAYLPKPGGDKIGRRRLDTHFHGFERLGAKFKFGEDNGHYYLDGHHLKGGYMLMDEISVTGTANMVMAAVKATGITEIYNAACEPYVQQLCRMLNSMGAKISGVGSNLLRIEGVDELSGTTHRILPDMIEIGSFIGLAAMTQSELLIRNCRISELGIIPSVFRKMGVNLEIKGDDIFVPSQDHYEIQTFIDGSILTIYDAPWPGFTPDLLSVILVMATQSRGSVLIHQKCLRADYFLWTN
jgi:UDP-N-acetylglucosamine 1-carboxyvinyltransferase